MPKNNTSVHLENMDSAVDFFELPEDKDLQAEKKSRIVVGQIVSWGLWLTVGSIISIILSCVVFMNTIVPSGSMNPTLPHPSRMFSYRLAYRNSLPERGDVVVFEPPVGAEDDGTYFVKRIIGTPGDTIEIIQGTLYVNGKQQDEPYLMEPMKGSFGPYKVPEGHYFVLGDNRNKSADARYWRNPYIALEDIHAKALAVYWPTIKIVK